jgi:hypothetical protein
VRLEVRSAGRPGNYEVVAVNQGDHEPETETPGVLPPQLPPPLFPAALNLARQVAQLDSMMLADRSPLLRIQTWQVSQPGLLLSRFDLSLKGRMLQLDGYPDSPLPGGGVADIKVAPGVGQDATWAISGALLAALGADASPTLQPLSLRDAPHSVTVRSLMTHERGLTASIRARRTEGCGWVDLSAAPVRPTTSQGRPTVQAPIDVDVVEAGGADGGQDVDEGFVQAVMEGATRLLDERLAHPLVQGPRGQPLRTLITRRSKGEPAVVVDGGFNRPRRTSAPPNRPPPGLSIPRRAPSSPGRGTSEAATPATAPQPAPAGSAGGAEPR